MQPRPAGSEPTVVANLADFDRKSGSVAERLLFNNRLVVVLVCLLVTAILGVQATKLRLNAGFEKMMPTKHPFIVNYLANKSELAGLGNTLLHRGGEHARHDLRRGVPGDAAQVERRDLPAARRRSPVHEVALDAFHALARRRPRRAWKAAP